MSSKTETDRAEPSTLQPLEHFYDFGPYRLDVLKQRLLRGGETVAVSPKAFDTLLLLVRHRERVLGKSELMEALWPETAVEEANLTQHVFTLRKILGDTPEGVPYIETVPRRGYRFASEVREVVEHAPAGGHRPAAGRGRLRFAALLTSAALVTALGVLWWRARAPAAGFHSLAVLPLENLSGQSEDEYFADGITEALITELAGIRSLRVTSRQSVMRYKKSGKSLPEIAAELRVDAVVEGSVARDGDRVRVSAQLIHAPVDRHLWAGRYERDLRDILALQAEVAAAIAAEVRATLTAPERARLSRSRSVDTEAYDLYLRGRFFFNRRWDFDPLTAISKSVEYLERSIAKDPEFALAHAALGEAYGPYAYWAPIAPDEARARRHRASSRALELDPDLAEAHTALASTLINEWDWPGAEREFQRAIEINPNYSVARFWYSLLLLRRARFEAALEQTELGLAADPFDPMLISNNAVALANLGRHEEAVARLRRTLELEPDSWGVRRTLAGFYVRLGRDTEALAEFARSGPADGTARVRALQGETAELHALLRDLHEKARRQYISPVTFASLYATLGDREQALAQLERAAETRAIGLVDVMSEAKFSMTLASPTMAKEFDSLRADPRFDAVRRRLKLE